MNNIQKTCRHHRLTNQWGEKQPNFMDLVFVHTQGSAYMRAAQHRSSEVLRDVLLARQAREREELGWVHSAPLRTEQYLARVYEGRGDLDEAAAIWRRHHFRLSEAKDDRGAAMNEMMPVYEGFVRVLTQLGGRDLLEANLMAITWTKDTLALYDPDSANVNRARFAHALVLIGGGKLDKAYELLNKVWEYRKDALGATSIETIKVKTELALVTWRVYKNAPESFDPQSVVETLQKNTINVEAKLTRRHPLVSCLP